MIDPEIERIQKLTENARHDSVTPERLIETNLGVGRRRLQDAPVYRRLREGEQPEFLFHTKRTPPVFNGPAAPKPIERSRRYQVVHLITDSRWLMMAGNTNGDQEHEIPLAAIKATAFDTEGPLTGRLSNNTFAFEIPGAHYQVPIANDFDYDDLTDLSMYLRDEFGAIRRGTDVSSDAAGFTIAGKDGIQYDAKDVRSRIDRLPDSVHDEGNKLLAETDSAEELIFRLDALLEEHGEETQTLDDLVRDASSIEELRQEIETPSERTTRQARDLASNHLADARLALDQADPADIGNWGLNVGQASVPLAIAAPGSTPLWIAAMLALGGAAGVHASGLENSPLRNIEPSELSSHVVAMADAGCDLDEINGEVAGALLGAFTYLGGRMAPKEFVKWIDAANPEAILVGANAGAAYGKRDDVDGTSLQGGVAGAGLGLLGSYVDADEEIPDNEDSLDAEELREYFKQLSMRGVATKTEKE